MVDHIILATKFKEECKLFYIDRRSSFIDFKNQVILKWSDLLFINYSFSCSIGSLTNCLLESDDDIRNIFIICDHSSIRLVYVDVCEIETQNQSQNSNGSENHFRKDTSETHCNNLVDETSANGGMEEFSGILSIPTYDVSPLLPKKTYLSDEWVEVFKGGVGSVIPGGKKGFRDAIVKYSSKLKFDFKFIRNEPNYIYVVCAEHDSQNCDWFVKAKKRPVTGDYEIYKAKLTHKCIGKLVNVKAKRLGPKIMSELCLEKFKNDNNICGNDVMSHIKDSYGFHIPYYKAWRTIEAAKDHVYGSYEDSYDQLRWYCAALERTNPGSVVALEHHNTTHRFERVFIAFKACMEGFLSCRPMLFIDGTFMKGRAKGTLLAATAKDGDNGLFPVAFAIVSSENIDNWSWFLCKLRDYIKHEKVVCYISDRNLGLMTAFNRVFEKPVHYFCLYHLLLNLKGRFSSGWTNNNRAELGELFKACAYAPNERLFTENVAKFINVGGQIAENWIAELPYDKWAVAYSPHIKRYGEMTSNAAESFNGWILDCRSLPITHMIDYVRSELDRWFVERRTKSNKWDEELVPNKHQLWRALLENGNSWCVDESSSGEYHVKSNMSSVVNLTTRTCSCSQWQLTGFPCSHVVQVISRHGGDLRDHVEDCFFTSNYRSCYKSDLHPIPDSMRFELQDVIGNHKILPPLLKRQPGRPKTKRIPSYGEHPKKKIKPSKPTVAL